ncbi:MAG TPA: QueT transporter family protein [Verrucomicrobiae bacterium]|nr:QueT transporter family protein [Verrucomicrobiae bacterium]
MRLNTKKLAVVTVFASLYAVGVVFLAPISFGIVQVRVADAMLPLAMIFGLPGALGLSLGCLVSNVFGGLGIVDIIGGASANLIACSLAWYIGRKGKGAQRFLGTVAITVVVGLIVGGYLSWLIQVPLEISILGVVVGEVIAVNLIGFPLEEAIRRSKIFRKYN